MKLQRLFSVACLALATSLAGFSGAASAQTSNVLQVATDATFPPMEFMKDGKRTGFDPQGAVVRVIKNNQHGPVVFAGQN